MEQKKILKKSNDPLKLRQVDIWGYKSISQDHHMHIELGQVNVLLGANGSGKSNLISFFKMLNFMMSGTFRFFIAQAGTSQFFLHYGPKRTKQINGRLYFENDTHFDDYSFELTYATPDRLIISSESIKWGQKGTTGRSLDLESDFKESALKKDSNDPTIKAIGRILSNCKVYQFHDSSSSSALRQSSRTDTVFYLQSEGNNLASFLLFLKNNHRHNYNQIVSYVQQILPQFKDFYLEPDDKGYVSLKWIDIFPNDYVFYPEQLSDGSIRFIALATLLLQPVQTMPSVVIIDEPELGLHPFAIGQLAEMIKEAALNTQIIIATQSPSLVDEFEANQITILEYNMEGGYSTARRLDEEELKDWLENYSLSELWNKNVLGGRP